MMLLDFPRIHFEDEVDLITKRQEVKIMWLRERHPISENNRLNEIISVVNSLISISLLQWSLLHPHWVVKTHCKNLTFRQLFMYSSVYIEWRQTFVKFSEILFKNNAEQPLPLSRLSCHRRDLLKLITCYRFITKRTIIHHEIIPLVNHLAEIGLKYFHGLICGLWGIEDKKLNGLFLSLIFISLFDFSADTTNI